MKKRKSPTHRKSLFFRQIFLSFVLTTAVLALLVTFFITAIYNNAIKSTVYRFNQKLLAQSNYSVQYINELAQRVTDSLNQDKNVIGFLYAEQSSPKEMVYLNAAVQKEILPLSYINSVYLYNENQDLFYSSKTGEQSSSERFYNKVVVNLLKNPEQLRQLQWRPVANNTQNNEDSPNVCSYIHPIWSKQTGELKSAMVINISVESLINTIEAINQAEPNFETNFLVVNQAGKILGPKSMSRSEQTSKPIKEKFTSQSALLPEIRERIQTEGESYFSYKVDGEKYLVMHNELNQNDWTLVGIFLEKDLFQDVNRSSYLSLAILFTLFFACVSFGFLNARRISLPIQKISQKIIDSRRIKDTKTTTA